MPKNKTCQTAVALTYRTGQAAPIVVAKGRGIIAEEIIRRGKESEVYVHESAELVALLMQVNLDDRIPPQLYVVVAELLAWLYRLEKGKEMPTGHSETANRSNKPELSQ
ncbi:MAG: EscU/YscU/HrcU family type III secretion system export apparatus switch protein [Nitrosomonas sp.]|nr:EscU/YscU/HrcU family type III secretion system export apparatus switch protein [Nitrosomonas sp.]MDP1950563.1 EscU/YscU/HrcU family type III secretion system export apparatus switch protein [Nitrosomonas sp.]